MGERYLEWLMSLTNGGDPFLKASIEELHAGNERFSMLLFLMGLVVFLLSFVCGWMAYELRAQRKENKKLGQQLLGVVRENGQRYAKNAVVMALLLQHLGYEGDLSAILNNKDGDDEEKADTD